MADHAARGQHQWILGINLLNGWCVFDDVEVRLAVREVKWPLTLRHRVPGMLLEQARCAGMVRRRARPEHAVLALYLFIGDPVIIGDAALRGVTEFVENGARRGEGKPMRPLQRLRHILDDAPVLPRLARAFHGFIDFDDAALSGRDDAFVLLLQRAGQHDVRVARAVVEEEIDSDVEFSFSSMRLTKWLSGSDTTGLKHIDSRPLISP